MRQKHLDRSRAYGEVHPPGSHGASFEQDGYHFDNDGKLVEGLLTPEQKDALSRPEQKQKAAGGPVLSAKQIELLRQAGTLTAEQEKAFAEGNKSKSPKSGNAGDGGDDDGKANDAGDPANDLNLELWLKGEIEYDFRDVQNAVKARFQKWCTRKDDLVQFLVESKAKGGAEVVAASQVCDALKKYLGEEAA